MYIPPSLVSWEPLRSHGFTRGAYRFLGRRSNRCITARPRLGILAQSLLVAVVGIAVLARGVANETWWGLPGLGAIVVGAMMLVAILRPTVFDPKHGYRGGWRDVFLSAPPTPCADIVGVQVLVGELRMLGRKTRYYEVNTVLHTSERRHITAHVGPHQARADADTLCAFLDVPLMTAPLPGIADEPAWSHANAGRRIPEFWVDINAPTMEFRRPLAGPTL